MHNFFLKLNFDEFFIGLILFTLPFPNDFNSKAIIIALVYFFIKSIRQNTLKKLKYYWGSVMFFLLQFISFLQSSNFYEAQKKLILFLPFIAFPLIFSPIDKNQVKIYRVLNYLLIGVLIILIYGTIRFSYDILYLNERFDYGRGISIFLNYVPHHAYLSIFILAAILSTTFGVIKKEVKTYQLFYLPVLYVSLFFLGSRIGVFISIFILPFFLFSQLKLKFGSRKVFFGLLFLIVSLTTIGLSNDFSRDKMVFAYYRITGKSTIDKATNKQPFNGIDFRKQIWESSINVISESPFFGKGVGDIQNTLNAQYSANSFYSVMGMNAHNQYFQWALTYGLIFCFFILFLMTSLIRLVFFKKNLLLLYIWLVLLLFSCTESILNRHWGVVFFSFILNLTIFLVHDFDKKP